MVKVRKGSQKGLTKLTRGGKKRAKRVAHKSSSFVQTKSVGETIVRSKWDTRKTRLQNYERLGLLTAVNDNLKPTNPPTSVVSELQNLANVGEEPALPRVVKGEFTLVDKLTSKYGHDYAAMARDIQINYLQWTPRQLQRKVEHVFKLRGKTVPKS